jgi:hypothetical protein
VSKAAPYVAAPDSVRNIAAQFFFIIEPVALLFVILLLIGGAR